MLSVAYAWFAVKRNCSKNSGGMIFAHAAHGGCFKNCCLSTGRYDGALRDDYFSRVTSNRPSRRLVGAALCVSAASRRKWITMLDARFDDLFGDIARNLGYFGQRSTFGHQARNVWACG